MSALNATIGETIAQSNQSIQICPPPRHELVVKILKYFIFGAIFAVSLSGNCFVCWVVWKRLRMRTVMNYYLVNLAAADLAFTLICIPFDLPVQEKSCIWPYFGALCKVLFPLQTLCASASVFTLTAIGYSRYRAIVHPLKTQIGLADAKKSIYLIWLASLVLVFPYVLVLRVNPLTGYCEEGWPEPKQTYSRIYSFTIFFADYAIPLPVVFVSYLKICRELRLNGDRVPVAQPDQIKDSEKVLKMSIVITIVFAVCALPNHIAWLVLDFFSDNKCAQCNTWVILANMFVFANSAADPIVYTVFNRRYRDEFKSLLNCQELEMGGHNENAVDLDDRVVWIAMKRKPWTIRSYENTPPGTTFIETKRKTVTEYTNFFMRVKMGPWKQKLISKRLLLTGSQL